MPDAAVLWAVAHVVSWSVYVGGTVVMELAWRPAQAALPPSQTAVACQWMGRRYRWLALVALLGIGVSGWARMATGGARSPGSPADPLSWSTAYGRTLLVVIALWVVLLGVLAVLSVVAHPALHARTSADLPETERRAARRKVHRAIRRMDRLLRLELVLALAALAAGASLGSGGLL